MTADQPGSRGGPHPVVVVGAGPAGLTAALRLVQAGRDVLVLESSDAVGGLSRTVERDGWRFDIGGHRFFTKVRAVERFWHELLPGGDFLVRPRLSRIYYRGKFYDYPIKPLNALRNLGMTEAVRCVASYARARARPPRDQSSLEAYIAAHYGWRLYRHFFKTYNEKLWGVPASELSADWGSQRIKGMSLWMAVWEPLRARLPGDDRHGAVTSLIESFHYPRLGPGMMWERCRDRVVAGGGRVQLGAEVRGVERRAGRAVAVHASVDGVARRIPCSAVISSMPLAELARSFDPPAPATVVEAAHRLHFRDFLTVALIVDAADGFPDNWIYVHEPDVSVGRIQNFGNWSPALVKAGRTCLGMEYFVHEDDGLWSRSDDELVALASAELARLGLVSPGGVQGGHVVRVAKAYPVYDPGYAERVDTIRRFVENEVPNVWPVGRNGMHRYNNQDHSMLTAMLAVENVLGAAHDVWAVNVEAEYHESHSGRGGRDAGRGTGRGAPVVSRPRRPPRPAAPVGAGGRAAGDPATPDGREAA